MVVIEIMTKVVVEGEEDRIIMAEMMIGGGMTSEGLIHGIMTVITTTMEPQQRAIGEETQ